MAAERRRIRRGVRRRRRRRNDARRRTRRARAPGTAPADGSDPRTASTGTAPRAATGSLTRMGRTGGTVVGAGDGAGGRKKAERVLPPRGITRPVYPPGWTSNPTAMARTGGYPPGRGSRRSVSTPNGCYACLNGASKASPRGRTLRACAGTYKRFTPSGTLSTTRDGSSRFS